MSGPAHTETDPSPPDPAVERARTVANVLDEAVRVPGTDYRVGLDPVLGVLPVAGDTVSAAISLYVVFEGYRAGLPPEALTKMLALVGVDVLGGSVPFVGPLFDAVWKANAWNVDTIESHLEGTRVPVEAGEEPA